MPSGSNPRVGSLSEPGEGAAPPACSPAPAGYDNFIPLPKLNKPTAAVEKRTISLPTEQAAYIDALVADGTYASAGEVVRAGLRALQERDAAVERWLREEVAPTYDAMAADPSRAIPAAHAFRTLRAHHAKRLKAKRGT
jgi:antitoxin ParD1/3/4